MNGAVAYSTGRVASSGEGGVCSTEWATSLGEWSDGERD
jgi:hypothetical protein